MVRYWPEGTIGEDHASVGALGKEKRVAEHPVITVEKVKVSVRKGVLLMGFAFTLLLPAVTIYLDYPHWITSQVYRVS